VSHRPRVTRRGRRLAGGGRGHLRRPRSVAHATLGLSGVGGGQDLGALAGVLQLQSLDAPRPQGHRWLHPLPGLDTGLLIDADRMATGRLARRGLGVGGTPGADRRVERLRSIGPRSLQPVPRAVRLEGGLTPKTGDRAGRAARCSNRRPRPEPAEGMIGTRRSTRGGLLARRATRSNIPRCCGGNTTSGGRYGS
jgi:hypothetical protein